jgi:hypothetical protein
MTDDYDPAALLLDLYGGPERFRQAQSGLDPHRWAEAEKECQQPPEPEEAP